MERFSGKADMHRHENMDGRLNSKTAKFYHVVSCWVVQRPQRVGVCWEFYIQCFGVEVWSLHPAACMVH